MSFLRTAASSSRLAPASRAFSSSSHVAAAMVGSRKPKDVFTMEKLPEYEYDDTTSLGFLRLLKMDQVREVISKMTADAAALNAQARKFQPPKGTIRITQAVDLSDPECAYNTKRVLIAPLAALPLNSPAAINRLKVLAGPRWTPGFPGSGELGPKAPGKLAPTDDKNAHGYVKISEERYPDGRMNRKSVSDILERLVAAANDPNSPIPEDTPVDMSHLIARHRKKRQHSWPRVQALQRRPEIVGGVRGFPKEWLDPAVVAKLK